VYNVIVKAFYILMLEKKLSRYLQIQEERRLRIAAKIIGATFVCAVRCFHAQLGQTGH